MKKTAFILLLLLIGTSCFAFEIQIPLYYVNAYNYLWGLHSNAIDESVRQIAATYNLYEMGGGLGADFYLWQNNTFGFYFRFNFYKPYKLSYTDFRFDNEYGLGNIGDLQRNLGKSYAFDMYFGATKKFKINKFEIPLAWAFTISPPRMTFIEYESNAIRHESFLDLGFVTEAALRYNINKIFFVQIGGLAGIGFATGKIFSSNNGESITGNIYFSGFLSAHIGVGFTIGKR